MARRKHHHYPSCIVLGAAAGVAVVRPIPSPVSNSDNTIENAEVIRAYYVVLRLRTEMYAELCHLLLFVTACSPGVYKTCFANKRIKNVKCPLAVGLDPGADVSITKVELKDKDVLNTDVFIIDVAGKPLQTLYRDQLAEESGLMTNALCEITSPGEFASPLKLYNMLKEEYVSESMQSDRQAAKMIAKVARVKQPVASSEVAAELGISAYSNHTTKAVNPPLRFLTTCQMWVFLLAVLLSASPVLSFTPDESAEIGSCRFDKTSVAVFSCVQPGGKWRPPSMACCSALLYAIDRLPASGESGACCLCRYTTVKYSSAGLVASYVLCQGKDRHIVTTWSVPITSCLGVCTRRKDSSHGMGTPAQKDRPLVHVHGSGSNIFEILWWIVAAAALCCVILLICFGYFWWFKPPTNARESQSLPLNIQMQVQHRGLSLGDDPRAERRRSSGRRSPVQLMERRRSSGQRSPVQLKERRMSSSRASPNG